MPLFVYTGHDAPGSADRRPELREAHLANLAPLVSRGAIRFAGPLRSEDGTPRGSLILFQAENFAAARQIAESDPYLAGGVFERVEVFSTLQVFPEEP